MDTGLIIFLVMLLAAVPLYVIAYLIGVKKRIGLISGLNPDRVTDKDALARWVGLMLFLMGVVTILMGLGIYLFIGETLIITLVGVALISALSIALIVGIQRYVS